MEGGGLSFRSACFHLRYPLLSTPIQGTGPFQVVPKHFGEKVTPLSLGEAKLSDLAPPSKGNLPRAQVFPLRTPFTKGRPLTVFTHPMPSLGHG
jgi:hypothetical protein